MQTLGQFFSKRMRRCDATRFPRDLMREHILTPARFYLPGFRAGRQQQSRGCEVHARVQRKTLDLLLKDARAMHEVRRSCDWRFSSRDRRPLKSLDAREAYKPPNGPRPARRCRAEKENSPNWHHDRCRARPLHHPRAGWPDRRQGYCD